MALEHLSREVQRRESTSEEKDAQGRQRACVRLLLSTELQGRNLQEGKERAGLWARPATVRRCWGRSAAMQWLKLLRTPYKW